MAITPLPAAPSRAVPSTFSTLADAFLGALSTFVTEANALETNVNAKEVIVTAQANAANIAMAAANFKGAWSALTGAAAIPYSVSHLGRYWMLITASSNITADVPGTSAKWQEIGNVTIQDFQAAVNPRAMSQGVAMTYAASGSSGITVADNDNIDYGTGNFFGVISVLLADYTPSAEVVLEQKTDGTNGRKFTLQTNGKLRVTINTTNYDSTIATGCTDNTMHVFGYSVTRETAAAAGSIIFVVDGVQLGDAVAITAGAPTTINNAVSQYVLGTSATRTAGTINGHISGNRALTAAEHLALCRNGIAEADKWGSQTELIMEQNNRDFSSGTIGNWTVLTTGNGTCVYDAGPGAVKTAKITVGATAGTYTAGKLTTANIATLKQYKRYKIKVSVYLPAGHAFTSVTCGPRDLEGAAYSLQSASLTTVNAWQTIWAEFLLANVVTGSIVIIGNSTTTGDCLYFDDVSIIELGANLALEPEGIQPAPGQWLDSSSNKLHALQPAAGSSLTRYKKDFEYRWTNTWTASSAAQYVGGLNQAVLSADHFITDIITQATVTTDVENLTLGDGSDTDRFVTAFAPSTTRTKQTIAAQNDGTNLKLVYTPAAEATMTVETIIRGFIWEP